MVIVTALQWWYTTGWLLLFKKVEHRVASVLRFFSVGQLLGSLFAPFRQISAGRTQGPLGAKMSAWLDRLFSRGVGAMIRLVLILCGLILFVLVAVVGTLVLILWPLLPLAPLIGAALALSGVV